MPLILGTNSIKDTGYNVANSLRFEQSSSDYMTRTFGTPTSSQTWTLSFWIKRSKLSSTQFFFNTDGGNEEDRLHFDSSDRLIWFEQDSAGSTVADLTTNRVFRDVSAWLHIVIARDSTQATSSNRIKIYVNGVQETSFATSTYPSLNDNSRWNTAVSHEIGARNAGTFVSAYLSEVVFIDGQQLDPTSFGEFDEDSPTIWKPKDVSGLTFGNNGFHLDFENASSLGADVSGNGNNFTVNNLTSIDQTTDTCTNNFATFNSLLPNLSSITYSEGNLKANASAWKGVAGTVLVNTGKWYAEIEWDAGSYMMIGIVSEDDMNNNGDHYGERATGYQYYGADGTIRNNGSTVATYSSYSTGDIIGVCLDCDNNKVYWSKNGTWQNSADPSAGTGGYSITADKYYTFACSLGGTAIANFGSPITSISSSNSDPNGYGNFEYGTENFYTLNTKNLAEFG